MGGTKNGKMLYGSSSWATESQGNHSWASGQSSETVATKERKAVTSAGGMEKGCRWRQGSNSCLTQQLFLALSISTKQTSRLATVLVAST